jgi:hypothetical protein
MAAGAGRRLDRILDRCILVTQAIWVIAFIGLMALIIAKITGWMPAIVSHPVCT